MVIVGHLVSHVFLLKEVVVLLQKGFKGAPLCQPLIGAEEVHSTLTGCLGFVWGFNR